MRSRVAVLVASLAAAPVSWPVAASAGSPQLRTAPSVPDLTSRTPGAVPAPTWDTFTADVTIRRRLVKKDGAVAAEAPEMRYRWVRTRGADGWNSTMSVVSVGSQRIQTSSGPQLAAMKIPVARVEAGPGQATRVFGASGEQLFMPPADALNLPAESGAGEPAPAGEAASSIDRLKAHLSAPRRPAPALSADAVERAARDLRSDDWIEQFLPSVKESAARKARLQRTLGTAHGSVRGLDRFLSNADGATTEVLSDPRWGVPVEINVVRNGALVSQTTIGYAEDPGAGLSRRRVRHELAMSPESGDRAVAEIDFTNIRLDRSRP
jgi:hypothetical protein